MKIIEKRIEELTEYKNNPRHNGSAVGAVAESIKNFGFKNPIIIDEGGEIIAGHTRLLAAKRLKLKKVPCIIADDLTDEQVKAFRLADNKTAELATWDFDLLNQEMEEILDIDMECFGFDIPDDPIDVEKENERLRTDKSYNIDRISKEDETEGFFEMPVLDPCHYMPKALMGFNYVLSAKDFDTGIHFYIDDYQFERLWNQPGEYMEKLSRFQCCLTPDFSLYLDMPMAIKIWNVYRSRAIGKIMQDEGMKVIPTVSWAEEDTFNFCFDGLPEDSTLSVSTLGVLNDDEAKAIWKAGMDELIRRKHPKQLAIYGNEIEYDFSGIKVKYYKNKVIERMKNGKD